MTLEELQIKLGLDHSGLASGMRRAQASVAEFGNTFKRVTQESGRAWKQTLHSIAQESPLLASALRIALSPITGTLMSAVMVFKTVHEAIKSITEVMKEFGKGLDSPIEDMQSKLRTLDTKLRESADNFKKWLKGTSTKDTVAEQLEERLELLRAHAKEVEKQNGGKVDPKMQRRQLEEEFALHAAALRQVSQRGIGLGDTADQLQKLNQAGIANGRLETAQALKAGNTEEVGRLNTVLAFLQSGGQEGSKKFRDFSEQLEAAKNRIKENNRTIDEETRIRKENAAALAEAQGKFKNNRSEFNTLSRSLEGSRVALAGLGPEAEDGRTIDQIQQDKIKAVMDRNAQYYKNLDIAREDQEFNQQHPLAHRNRLAIPTAPKTVEQSMAQMTNDLRDLANAAKNGMPVFSKED